MRLVGHTYTAVMRWFRKSIRRPASVGLTGNEQILLIPYSVPTGYSHRPPSLNSRAKVINDELHYFTAIDDLQTTGVYLFGTWNSCSSVRSCFGFNLRHVTTVSALNPRSARDCFFFCSGPNQPQSTHSLPANASRQWTPAMTLLNPTCQFLLLSFQIPTTNNPSTRRRPKIP